MDSLLEIQKLLESLRPAMQADGGDVELVSIEGGTVSVRLRGTCLVCPSASLTMKLGIERTLLASIPWVTCVIRVP
jgi:Fe-S cluster biogenesis protein NfuA